MICSSGLCGTTALLDQHSPAVVAGNTTAQIPGSRRVWGCSSPTALPLPGEQDLSPTPSNTKKDSLVHSLSSVSEIRTLPQGNQGSFTTRGLVSGQAANTGGHIVAAKCKIFALEEMSTFHLCWMKLHSWLETAADLGPRRPWY